MSESTPLTCTVHPNRSANLRCNRCERPMCTQCAVLTPTGYRCRECIRGQQKIFNSAETIDYVVAFLVAALLSGLASLLVFFFNFWALLAAAPLGGLIAEAVRWAVRRHRSPALYLTAAIATAVGVLPVFGLFLLRGAWLQVVVAAAFAGLAAVSLYYRLKGIQVR